MSKLYEYINKIIRFVHVLNTLLFHSEFMRLRYYEMKQIHTIKYPCFIQFYYTWVYPGIRYLIRYQVSYPQLPKTLHNTIPSPT